MFTVLSDNCLKPGSPEAKEGRGAKGREQLLLLLLLFKGK